MIKPTSEMIFYGVLDLLAGPLFIFCLLWNLRSVDYNAFGFASGKYTDTVQRNGVYNEKTSEPAGEQAA